MRGMKALYLGNYHTMLNVSVNLVGHACGLLFPIHLYQDQNMSKEVTLAERI